MRDDVVPERVANQEIDVSPVFDSPSLGNDFIPESAGTFCNPGGRPIFTEKLTSDLRGVTRIRIYVFVSERLAQCFNRLSTKDCTRF